MKSAGQRSPFLKPFEIGIVNLQADETEGPASLLWGGMR